LAFLLYVLYINFLPFGFNRTYTIQVGGPNDDNSSMPFYLEPSQDLSARMTDASGTPYRELSGAATIDFNPGVMLNDESITASVPNNLNIQIIPQNINPDSMNWNYIWSFATSTPSDLIGTAYHFDNCEYFDGQDGQLQLPNSNDEFASRPFTVYAAWTPTDSNDDFQEIVGHYNWELLQNSDSVSFQVGRMDTLEGPFYSVSYPVSSTFFNEKHTAVAIYQPSENGWIALYVDGNLAGVSSFGTSTIDTDYGSQDLMLGKSNRGGSYLKGCIDQINIGDTLTIPVSTTTFRFTGTELKIFLESIGNASLHTIKLNAQ
jgi:hypothetical protein